MSKNMDLFKTTLLNSSLTISPNIYKIFSTALERNFTIGYRIALEDYNDLEMGFGIKTLDKIYKNTEIIRIPLDIGFNGSDLIDFKDDIRKSSIKTLCWKIAKIFFPNNKFRMEKNFQNQMLMWQIILNTYYKEAYNYELVESFPKQDMTHPIYATQELYEEISSRNLRKYYYDNKLVLQIIYENIKKEAIYELTFEEVAWAYNNALSRKILVVDEKSLSPLQFILPIVDYLNHSSTKANCFVDPHYDNINKESYLTIKAANDIQQGEQLYLNYGLMFNKKFMNMYGFFDKENPLVQSEFYIIGNGINHWLEIKHDQDKNNYNDYIKYVNSFQDDKREILIKNHIELDSYNNEFNLMLYPDRFDTKFMKYLRVIFLENSDILNNKESILSHDFSSVYSFINENKVLDFINFMLERHYSYVKNVSHEEQIRSLGKIDSSYKFKKKCMFMLEAEEKFLLEKNINFISKKIKNYL